MVFSAGSRLPVEIHIVAVVPWYLNRSPARSLTSRSARFRGWPENPGPALCTRGCRHWRHWTPPAFTGSATRFMHCSRLSVRLSITANRGCNSGARKKLPDIGYQVSPLAVMFYASIAARNDTTITSPSVRRSDWAFCLCTACQKAVVTALNRKRSLDTP